jgi:hypothetical protein
LAEGDHKKMMTLRVFSLCFWILFAVLALSKHVASDASVNEEPVDPVELSEDEAAKRAEAEKHFNSEAFQKLMSMMSEECGQEVQANPDPNQLSNKCKREIQRNARKLMQEAGVKDAEQSGDDKKSKKKSKKDGKAGKAGKKKKGKRSKKAAREAAELKKEEEYQHTLKVIAGFVVTLVAGIVGAIVVINKKLKAAGKYYPSDPDAKAGCCG